jgi:hypothetical protein
MTRTFQWERNQLQVPNHDEEVEAGTVPPTLESGEEDEEDVTISPPVNHTAIAGYIKKYPQLYTKEFLERIDNLVSKTSDYDGVGTTEPSSVPAPIRTAKDDFVGQLRAIERAAAIDTRNSDDDSVGPTEPSSPPAPIRNDNLSDNESVGQLRNIERAAVELLSNGGPVQRESGIDSGSKTKSKKTQKKRSVKHGGSDRKRKRTSKSKRRRKQGAVSIPYLPPSSPETDRTVEGSKDSDSDFDMGGGSEYCLSKTDTKSSSSTNSS